MADGLILFHHRQMCLTVSILTAGSATCVEEEFGLVQILLVTRHQIKFRQCHFGNLMSRHQALLVRPVAYRLADAVGVADGYIQEVPFSGSLVMGYSTLYHVSQVIEFMAQVLYSHPALRSCPIMGMLRVHGTGGIQVSIRFLRSGNNRQHAVYIPLQLLIGISLQRVAGPLNGLVYVGIIEGEPFYFILFTGMSCFHKVFIASRLLTFAECQRDGYFTACPEALSPEAVRHFDGSKRHRGDGVARMQRLLLLCNCTTGKSSGKCQG